MTRGYSLSTLLTVCATVLSVGGEAAAQNAVRSSRADTGALHRTLDSLAKGFHGSLGYTVHNIDTGERFGLRGDETFPTASLIKVSVLVTLFDMAEKGEIAMDDHIALLKVDKVPGSGTLQFMHDGLEVTVRDAAWLMITISDNTATNLLLDKVAIRKVWQKMEALGLPHTKIHAKSFLRITSVAPDSSVKYGLGVTTPNEMARLFQLLADAKAVSPRADSTMLDILAHNEDDKMMQRYVAGVSAPHKTGANEDMRTECALFRLQTRVVACVLTKENVDKNWLIDNEAQVTMGRMGLAIVSAWPKKATTP
jgi:beta-lactamase class A